MSTEVKIETLMSKVAFDAQKIVNENHKHLSKLPIKVWETLTHDGYDYYGPKSDIWDLYIVYKSDIGYLVQRYHRENWFDGSDQQYQHYKNYSLKSEEELNEFTK